MKTYKTKISAARAAAKATGIVIEKGQASGPRSDGTPGQGQYMGTTSTMALMMEWYGYIEQTGNNDPVVLGVKDGPWIVKKLVDWKMGS